MFEKLRVVFTIPELRKKILLTLGLLAVYRVGWQVPLPVLDPAKMEQYLGQQAAGLGDLLRTVAVFSASQLNQATIFGLGIMPYISASIIFQLLASFWGPLEKLQKEGEVGRKKINQYTRIATVFLCVLPKLGLCRRAMARGLGGEPLVNPAIAAADGSIAVRVACHGRPDHDRRHVFLMWLGEQIDEYGIGNGISLLIMANIIAAMPGALQELGQNTVLELGGGGGSQYGIETLIVLVVLFVLIVAGVVLMTQGQRRIPTQSAKHVRGRRVFGGGRQYLPLARQSVRRHANHLRQQPCCSFPRCSSNGWHRYIRALDFGSGSTIPSCAALRSPTTCCLLRSSISSATFGQPSPSTPRIWPTTSRTSARLFPATGPESAPPITWKR